MNRRRYTHLLQPDRDLFALYLSSLDDPYAHIDFDVRVGLGADPGDNFPDYIRHMAIHLSQRRIDAVGFTGNRIDIIEITTKAGLTALGQLHAYPQLYRQTFFPSLPLVPVLVTHGFQPDVQPLFESAGFRIHVLPRPE